MAIDSSEIPHEQAEAEPKPPRGTPIGDKMLIGGVKAGVKTAELTGKGIIGVVKLTKDLASPPVRLAARNAWGSKLGLFAAAVAPILGSVAGNYEATRAYGHSLKDDPVKAMRSAIPAAKDALMEAVDTAFEKSGTKVDLSIESIDLDTQVDKTIDLYFPGKVGKDRQLIETNILVMHEYYKGNEQQPGLLPKETFEIVGSHYDLISQKCGFKQWLMDGVTGLAIAESRGGVDGGLENMTEAGALGPFMMTEDFIREHGYEPTNDENDPRLSWEITVPIVVDELTKRTEHFGGNLAFAVWSWQRGVRAVDDDLRNFAGQRGLPTDVPIAQLVKDNTLTEFDLEENEIIRKELSHPEQDSTNIFVLRNAAGALIWRNVVMLAQKIRSQEDQKTSAKITQFTQKDQKKAA